VIATDPTLSNFHVGTRTQPSGQGVIVGYAGILGNRPQSFGNTVAVWDTWSPILDGPTPTQPLCTVPVPQDEQPSTVDVPWGFGPTDYLISYQAGGPYTTMCATRRLSLSIALMSEPPSSVMLGVAALDAQSVTLTYNALLGCKPKSWGHWVGVWTGFPAPYAPGAPDGWAAIESDRTQGVVTVTGLEIYPTLDYSVIYFMGPVADGVPGTALGALLTFTAGA
jgi:hypothetical protein